MRPTPIAFDRRRLAGAIAAALLAARPSDVLALARSGHATPEDARFMAQVLARLQRAADALKIEEHRTGGKVVLLFKLDARGAVTARDMILRTGDPAADALALRILNAAAPFPTPPATLKGLYLTLPFDGGVPRLRMIH